ncbi:uncharacterized protein CLUP02_18240 [Colletotrichum lupini]|uniref:Uncharacterized protein n=1 Tax=Colletotrichum lupini TaxID=145971 RepID=A0A9Q8SGE3_9PEZI|nr:uncharacterized protein CLUP02_18240 [Colletotrichum lupini]UQC76725.1 hypothetical protein CLUP02_18240 [Colletotrichum lupini]
MGYGRYTSRSNTRPQVFGYNIASPQLTRIWGKLPADICRQESRYIGDALDAIGSRPMVSLDKLSSRCKGRSNSRAGDRAYCLESQNCPRYHVFKVMFSVAAYVCDAFLSNLRRRCRVSSASTGRSRHTPPALRLDNAIR